MSWEDGERRLERGPVSAGIWVIGIIFVLSLVGGLAAWGLGLFGEAASVAQKEFGPRAALKKYEWFIEQASSIQKMDKDAAMFESRAAAVKEQYKGYGADMAKWPPHIQAQYNKDTATAREDLLAVASQRNTLVRDYNAASDKFNWSLFQTRPDKPKEHFYEYVLK